MASNYEEQMRAALEGAREEPTEDSVDPLAEPQEVVSLNSDSNPLSRQVGYALSRPYTVSGGTITTSESGVTPENEFISGEAGLPWAAGSHVTRGDAMYFDGAPDTYEQYSEMPRDPQTPEELTGRRPKISFADQMRANMAQQKREEDGYVGPRTRAEMPAAKEPRPTADTITKPELTPTPPVTRDTVPVGKTEVQREAKQTTRTPVEAATPYIKKLQDLMRQQGALLGIETLGGEADGVKYPSKTDEFQERLRQALGRSQQIEKETAEGYTKDSQAAHRAAAIDKGIGALGKIVSGVVGMNPNMAFSGSRVLPVAEHFKYSPQVDLKEEMAGAKQQAALGSARAKSATESVLKQEEARRKESERITKMVNDGITQQTEILKNLGMNDQEIKDIKKAALESILNTNIPANAQVNLQKDAINRVPDAVAMAAHKEAKEGGAKEPLTQLTSGMFEPSTIAKSANDGVGETLRKMGKQLQIIDRVQNPQIWSKGIMQEAVDITPRGQKVTGEYVAKAYQNYLKDLFAVPNTFDVVEYPKWQARMRDKWGVTRMPIAGVPTGVPGKATMDVPGVLRESPKTTSRQSRPAPASSQRQSTRSSDPYGVLGK